MVPVNNITTTAIADELKVSSHNVGYLCSNKHGQINPAAKYKPVSYKKYERLTKAELKSVRHGIDIPYISCGLVCNSNPWVYQPPTGGENSPYRMSDFGGYSQDAVYPLTCILPEGDEIESTGSASTNNPFRFIFVFSHSNISNDGVSLLADEVYTDVELGWYPTLVLTDGSNYYCISTPDTLGSYITSGKGAYGAEINLSKTPWYSSSSNGTTIKAGLCLLPTKCNSTSNNQTVGLNGAFTGYGRSVECTVNSHVRTYTIKVTEIKWYNNLKFTITYTVNKSISASYYSFSISSVKVTVTHSGYDYVSFGNFYIKPYLHIAGNNSSYNKDIDLGSYSTINGTTLNNSGTYSVTLNTSTTTYTYPLPGSGIFGLELRMCNSLNGSEVGSNGQQSINIILPFTNNTWLIVQINTTNSAFTAQLS